MRPHSHKFGSRGGRRGWFPGWLLHVLGGRPGRRHGYHHHGRGGRFGAVSSDGWQTDITTAEPELALEPHPITTETTAPKTAVATVCAGKKCARMGGGKPLMNSLRREFARLGLAEAITVEACACVDDCEGGPLVLAQGPNGAARQTFRHVTPNNTVRLAAEIVKKTGVLK